MSAPSKVWALEYDDGDFYQHVELKSIHATAESAKAAVPSDDLTPDSEWRWTSDDEWPGWEIEGRSQSRYFVTEYEVQP